jgi:hypothetical protein
VRVATGLGGASENFLALYGLFQGGTLKLCEFFWVHRSAWPRLAAEVVHFENHPARACLFLHMPSGKRCQR